MNIYTHTRTHIVDPDISAWDFVGTARPGVITDIYTCM